MEELSEKGLRMAPEVKGTSGFLLCVPANRQATQSTFSHYNEEKTLSTEILNAFLSHTDAAKEEQKLFPWTDLRDELDEGTGPKSGRDSDTQ